jgi:hypothetical protein
VRVSGLSVEQWKALNNPAIVQKPYDISSENQTDPW